MKFDFSGQTAIITGAAMVIDGGLGCSNGQLNIPQILTSLNAWAPALIRHTNAAHSLPHFLSWPA